MEDTVVKEVESKKTPNEVLDYLKDIYIQEYNNEYKTNFDRSSVSEIYRTREDNGFFLVKDRDQNGNEIIRYKNEYDSKEDKVDISGGLIKVVVTDENSKIIQEVLNDGNNNYTGIANYDNKALEKVEKIAVSSISNFPNHPYQVKENEEMEDFVENIKENGVIHPVIVRPKEDGTYEMISGHRRKRACELAGIKEIPAIVRNMSNEDAIIYMVDSNKQRERILPSEKAFAYKMKLEAMKRQGQRNDLETSSPTATKLNKSTAEIIGADFGEEKDNVYRYIRLTELIPELLQLVDDEKMKLRPAVEISYLTKSEQEYVFEVMEYNEVFPSHPQARELKKLSADGNLTDDDIDRILSEEKPNQKENIKFSVDKVKGYFPKEYTPTEMQKIIVRLLENYQLKWQKEKELKKYDR